MASEGLGSPRVDRLERRAKRQTTAAGEPSGPGASTSSQSGKAPTARRRPALCGSRVSTREPSIGIAIVTPETG